MYAKNISNGKYFPCHLRLGSMFVMFNCFEISNRPLFGLVATFMAFSCSFPMFYGSIYQLWNTSFNRKLISNARELNFILWLCKIKPEKCRVHMRLYDNIPCNKTMDCSIWVCVDTRRIFTRTRKIVFIGIQ